MLVVSSLNLAYIYTSRSPKNLARRGNWHESQFLGPTARCNMDLPFMPVLSGSTCASETLPPSTTSAYLLLRGWPKIAVLSNARSRALVKVAWGSARKRIPLFPCGSIVRPQAFMTNGSARGMSVGLKFQGGINQGLTIHADDKHIARILQVRILHVPRDVLL